MYVLLHAGALRCHGLWLVLPAPQVHFSMYFEHVAANLGEYFAGFCRPVLHRHYSPLAKGA
jgi:hypothetical protein